MQVPKSELDKKIKEQRARKRASNKPFMTATIRNRRKVSELYYYSFSGTAAMARRTLAVSLSRNR